MTDMIGAASPTVEAKERFDHVPAGVFQV